MVAAKLFEDVALSRVESCSRMGIVLHLEETTTPRRMHVKFYKFILYKIQGGFFDCSALKMTKYKEK